MASKYTLKDLPTSGKYTYKGKDYPKWDVDGLPVSSNDLWVAMGMDDHTFNPATDPEGDAIERDCIVWTDETKPIDSICKIASEQCGSGTTEKIVADIEKRITNFNGLVMAIKKWYTGADGEDGATAGLWNWLPMSMIPDATDKEWYDKILCEAVDQYIGSRGDLRPEVSMDDVFSGNMDAIQRLDAWARQRAQEIYDGCREINEQIKKEHAEAEVKKKEVKPDWYGKMVFTIYNTDIGPLGYLNQLYTQGDLNNFFEDDTKIVAVYALEKGEYEDHYVFVPVEDALKKALEVEEYINKKGE